jgi:hypothetical protein
LLRAGARIAASASSAAVYARVFEDDLLDATRREQSADRVRELLDRINREPEEELWPVAAAEERLVERRPDCSSFWPAARP